MMWFKKIFIKLGEWFHSSYKAKFVDDLPKTFSKKTVYIVGLQDNPWLLAFECPCGCKSTIQLNILQEAMPRWKFKILSKNKIEISPSIMRITGCKSHFFIRNGRIKWC